MSDEYDNRDRDGQRRRAPRDNDRHSQRSGSGKPRRDGENRPPRRDGDFKPRRDGEFKPRRDGEGRPRRDSDFKPRRDGDFKPRRDRDFKPRRDGDFKPRRDGDFKPRRDGEFKPRREGEFKPRRDGDFKPRRDGESKPRRDGDFKPRREGDNRGPHREHNNERERSFAPRDRKYRGGEGRERSFAETDGNDFRPVRSAHQDPEVPRDITPQDLHPQARNELKTLEKELAEYVAKHLAAVAFFVDEDPERAHQHAISAMRRASRIPVTRETYAITSYITGDYATAIRELRTYRRLTGSDMQLALMIDAERALGRPEKAIEVAHEADVSKLPNDVQVQVAIAVSGARLDLGQTEQALYELDIPQLNPNKAFSWSPELFAAYSVVLEDLGRAEEALEWKQRAFAAEHALSDHRGGGAIEIIDTLDDEAEEAEGTAEEPLNETE